MRGVLDDEMTFFAHDVELTSFSDRSRDADLEATFGCTSLSTFRFLIVGSRNKIGLKAPPLFRSHC